MTTKITWFIKDPQATLRGTDELGGVITRDTAEEILDQITAKNAWTKFHKRFYGVDLPHFSDAFKSCDNPEDWGVLEVKMIE